MSSFPEPIKLHDDETSSTQSEASDTVPNTFEGPEKNLEIDFKLGVGNPRGLREVPRHDLDEMLEAGQCQILSRTSNEHIDAYVLSESSMFIYAHKIVLKTCGTTTLLKCLPFIKTFSERLGLGIEWVNYSRKNYTFPEEQKYPHTSFQTEVAFLSSYFPDGSAHVLGPLNHDHWYIYAWDADIHEHPGALTHNYALQEPRANESTLQVLMQDMHPSVAKQFYKNNDSTMTSRRMTIESGIRDLVPGAMIDDFAFDPCGYSMNGILFDAYYTIHITPESHCSYVSFETNARLRSYASLLKNVLRCFRPAKYSVSVYTDRNALESAKGNNMFAEDLVKIDDDLLYKRKGGHTQATFEGDYMCRMANYSQSDKPAISRAAQKIRSPSFA
ncbi:S-adenosylmethionine decarboxylase proenzyme [Phytophthora megakarya]|uniref:S-adenosylmethionine decarboxylase proenzyme n=1 Tax=Phytophthora megakarya TaxID=4795 RepID=A0A225WIR5_9STRA|nr:S-adenosylmethionine decarboxylase proenzyme [Phytophthora megakarya]